MKIVFCTQNMAPFRMRWMDEISKYHSVIVYHLDEYEAGLNKKYISYVPQRIKIKCHKKTFFDGSARYIISDIINEHADVYILDGYGFRGQQELIIKLHMKHIPFIMSIDGGFIRNDEGFLKRKIKSFFISKAKAYLSTSWETDKYIDYYGGRKKEKYRHLFSNITNDYIEEKPATDIEKKELRKELKMNNSFSVISVGKSDTIKGFDLLINAFKEVPNNIELYFIGTSNSKMYDRYLTSRIKDRVHFISFCDQETLKKYYKAADLFILPTRGDVWGLVISEAMANGIITITTNKCLAGIAMLEENEIIPDECEKAISQKINYYNSLDNKESYEIGVRNIKKAKKYTIESATILDIEHIEDFYRKKRDRI